MNDEHGLNKLKKFQKELESFTHLHKSAVEDVHSLRLKCREIHSLLDKGDEFYAQIKRVIKLSNEIRDIDVFFELYLASLPKKYLLKLDIKNVINFINEGRERQLKKLHKYLESLSIPKIVTFDILNHEINVTRVKEPTLDKDELHKYRIYIKKILYMKKNSFTKNNQIINVLSQIKDVLGRLNDNFNGLKRLKNFGLKEELFEKIEKFTQKENLRFFTEFQELNKKYIGSAL